MHEIHVMIIGVPLLIIKAPNETYPAQRAFLLTKYGITLYAWPGNLVLMKIVK